MSLLSKIPKCVEDLVSAWDAQTDDTPEWLPTFIIDSLELIDSNALYEWLASDSPSPRRFFLPNSVE